VIAWFLFLGAVLVLMALVNRWIQAWPVSPAIAYLALGALFGPAGISLITWTMRDRAALIEIMTEIVILISLFAIGLKLRLAWKHPAWRVPLRLATVGMVLTIMLSALAAWALLELPIAVCILLGAILAPTDPVLASDIQTRHAEDRDAVRVSLSAEGGINDSAALPAVLLGLGLLGLYPIGSMGLQWLLRDLLWASAAGLAIGWMSGRGVANLVLWLRARGQALEFEEFLVLGLIALTYGAALSFQANGFLAVFTAGLAVRAIGEEPSASTSQTEETDLAQNGKPKQAVRTLTSRLLIFTEQLERLAEVGVVLLIGALLSDVQWSVPLLLFVGLMLLVVRKAAVTLVLIGTPLQSSQRRLLGWFGIRGVGSLYYLSYALAHGLPAPLAGPLIDATLATVAASILLHGVSATPIMQRYEAARSRRRSRAT
jgi:sodium/hydrogen antiporter